MALIYGWAMRDLASGLILWPTFQTQAPTPQQASTYERVFKFDSCLCSSECDDMILSPEVEQYPQEYEIDLTETLGDVTFSFIAVDPTKFQVQYLNTTLYDSGYRGDTARQYELDVWLTSHGYPTETISGTLTGSYTFPKVNSLPTGAIVRVFAPLSGYDYSFTLACPVGTTTTSSTSTTSSSSTTSTSSSTTSTTTTLPPGITLEWEFDASAIVSGASLTAVTVEDSASNKLWDNEPVDLTVVDTEARSLPSTIPTYSFTMTSASATNMDYNVWTSIDGGAESILYGPVNFPIGATSANSGLTDLGATSSIKYIIRFTT